MKTTIVLLAIAALLVPVAGGAASKPHAKVAFAPLMYRAHCGMVYTAAEAKKDHYICPMDHLKMVPINLAVKKGGNQ